MPAGSNTIAFSLARRQVQHELPRPERLPLRKRGKGKQALVCLRVGWGLRDADMKEGWRGTWVAHSLSVELRTSRPVCGGRVEGRVRGGEERRDEAM